MYRPHGQWGTWGNSIQGVWGTGYMGNRAHRVMITGGMGHMDNGTHGLWGTGVWGTWAMGYRGMGHMSNGVQWYGAHGQ